MKQKKEKELDTQKKNVEEKEMDERKNIDGSIDRRQQQKSFAFNYTITHVIRERRRRWK